jgi:hypothetical protein
MLPFLIVFNQNVVVITDIYTKKSRRCFSLPVEAFLLYKIYMKPIKIADITKLLMLAVTSSPSKFSTQEISPARQPKVKKIAFHAECVTIANQPFPLIHVLRLKKSDGITNNQFK